MMKKVSYKHYNKWIITRGNGSVQSHDQEQSKLNITIVTSCDSLIVILAT